MMATHTAERAAAEDAVDRAYRYAGLDAPHHIRWAPSPMELERDRKTTWCRDDPGRVVRSDIIDDVFSAARAKAEKLPASVLTDRSSATGQVSDAALHLVDGLVVTEVASRGWRGTPRLRGMMVRAARRRRPLNLFVDSRWAPYHDRGRLTITDLVRRNQPAGASDPRADALLDLASEIGCIVAHEKTCWISDRWEVLRLDERGRLHSGDGPAIAYRDGWKRYFWKGIEVPEWAISQRDRISPRLVHTERRPIVKRCLIEIMTPEKFIRAGGARVVSRDWAGTLWRAQWTLSDAWAAVEVVNGTVGPDHAYPHYFLQVPPHFDSAADAVAWTYGMSTVSYARLEHRT